MLAMQKEEANIGFAKFIARNYLEWIDLMRNGNAGKNGNTGKNGNASSSDDRPMMSPDVFRNRIFPILDKGEKVFLIVIDNFRYDQWKMLAADIGELFDIDEDMYMSILPTATQYARNAIFSGVREYCCGITGAVGLVRDCAANSVRVVRSGSFRRGNGCLLLRLSPGTGDR